MYLTLIITKRRRNMGLLRQAKTLTEKQQNVVLDYLEKTRHPVRNALIFLLSFKSGLRAKEIASVTWSMICDNEGKIDNFLKLEDKSSKGKSGRIIPLNKQLKEKLVEYKNKLSKIEMNDCVIRTERSRSTSPQVIVNFFQRLYKDIGYEGCSSHSGRRNFITNCSRKISLCGGSLKEVQLMCGHRNLQTTSRYIEHNNQAMKKVDDMI